MLCSASLWVRVLCEIDLVRGGCAILLCSASLWLRELSENDLEITDFDEIKSVLERFEQENSGTFTGIKIPDHVNIRRDP